jgi:tetratricopeptide (TPR) repeat protein/O-antigen ligase
VKALPWRPTSRADAPPDDASAKTASVPSERPALQRPAWAAWIIRAEPWLAPLSATTLLLAPNPLLWPAAVVGVLPSAARLATTGRPWGATAFDLPLALLGVGALLGGYASLSADGALVRLAGLLGALVLFAALREHASGERGQRAIVVGSLVGAVGATLVLLVLVGPFLLLDRVPFLPALTSAIDRGGYAAWFVDQDWLLQRYRFRASGVGALADVGLALALAAFLGLRGMIARLLVLVTVPLFLLTLLVADNRGSMLAGVLTLGLMATVWRRRLLALAPVVAVLAILVVAFGPSDRGLSMKTLAQRYWFWENSLYLAKEVPLTGAGLGLESVQLVYRGYFLPAYPPFSHAHNIYLQGLLEYGVLGLLGLIGLGIATAWIGWRAATATDRWTVAARLAGYGVAMAMFTSGLTEIVLHSTLGCVMTIAALGLLAATVRSVPSRPPGATATARPTVRWQVGRSGLAVAIVAAVALVAIATVLALSGRGSLVAARLLLNAGTADLNRATFSETISRQERSTALNRALDSLSMAATLAPDDATIQRNLALALVANDEARQARTAADKAKSLIAATDGGGSRADLLQLGRAFVAVSNWGEAIRAWQAADAAPQLIQLGNRLIRLRNFDQAGNAFLATARVDPQSRSAYEGVVRAARERKASTDETVAALDPLAVPGSPTELGARLQAGRVLREAGRLQDAVRQLQLAESLGAPPELSFEYGRVWLAAGIPFMAEPLLVRPTADLPYDAESWLWYARSLAELGRPEGAVAAIQQGLSRLDPSGQFAPPAERLPETAAVRAVEIRRSERAPLLGVMGENLIRLGRTDEAIRALDEAVAAQPKDGWLAATRAEALAVRSGASPNLLFNGTFDRDGSWSLRSRQWPGDEGWRLSSLLNEAPTFDDGRVRLAPADASSRVLAQYVPGVVAGHQYRFTARVRAEQAGAGGIMAFAATSATSADAAEAIARSRSAGDWTTLTLDVQTGTSGTGPLVVGIGFDAGTPPGAVLWCDEATLVDLGPAP